MGKMRGVSKLPKKTLYILFGIIIVVIIAGVAGVAMMGGDETPSGGGGISMNDLRDWSLDVPSFTQNLQEGSATAPSSVEFDLADLMGPEYSSNGTYFISEVTATLIWQDGPDERHAGRMRYNDPDNFQLEINSTANASEKSEVVGNDQQTKQGKIGPITMSVTDGAYTYIVMGNATGLKLPDVATTGNITVIVYLYEAEDLYADGPAALKWNDFGNDFTLSVSIKGKVYLADQK